MASKWTETWIDANTNAEFEVTFEMNTDALGYLVARARKNKHGRAQGVNGALKVHVSAEGRVLQS